MTPLRLVVAALCAAALVIGLVFGRNRLDEGEVIVFYADRYASETGQPAADCHGVPGRREDVWLIVLCEGAAGRFAYPVGHDGALVEIEEDEA